MKLLVVLASFLSFSAFAAGGSKAAPASAATYKVDSAASKVAWKATKKLGSSHNGTVVLKSGEITVEKSKLTGGKFTMDMTTIKDLDMPESDSMNAKLIGHLKSDDFFGVDKNPEATLAIKSVKEVSAGKVEVTGDLTIKGTTAPVTFPADVTFGKDSATAKGKIIVDRTKYNVKYGSGSFFKLPADKIINDTFDLDFDVTAKK